MAEQRQKIASILLTTEGKRPVSIELFPAEAWEDRPESAAGLLRLRQDGKWLCPEGRKYAFFAPEAVGAHVARLLAERADAEACPVLPRGSRVRVHNGNAFGDASLYDCTHTHTEPYQAVDGRWYVHVLVFGKGLVPVPCCDVELLGGRHVR